MFAAIAFPLWALFYDANLAQRYRRHRDAQFASQSTRVSLLFASSTAAHTINSGKCSCFIVQNQRRDHIPSPTAGCAVQYSAADGPSLQFQAG